MQLTDEQKKIANKYASPSETLVSAVRASLNEMDYDYDKHSAQDNMIFISVLSSYISEITAMMFESIARDNLAEAFGFKPSNPSVTSASAHSTTRSVFA